MSDTATGTVTEGAKPETPEGAKPEGTEPETPTVEDLLKEIETLKGHSRKWEDRAKENFEAKTELDKIRREGMTDAERLQADVADANTRAEQAEDRAAKAEAALTRYKVATEFGLSAEDAETLSSIEDEATLRSLAERLAGRSTGTRPNPAQGRGARSAPATPAEAFAEAMGDLF